LFLTLGIISWFAADLTLAYYYFALGIEQQILVSVTDFLWFIGYPFFAANLFTVLQFIRNRIKLKTIILTSIASLLFITYIALDLFPSSRFIAEGDLTAFVVTVAYPILDILLFVPSMIILMYNPFHGFFHLSLLISAVADERYVNDFVNGRLHNLLFWNIFYVTDFILMAGALF
jgi:hypothetical protein